MSPETGDSQPGIPPTGAKRPDGKGPHEKAAQAPATPKGIPPTGAKRPWGDGPRRAKRGGRGVGEAPAWTDLTPGPDGLVPAVVQDTEGNVRMVGYMSEAALQRTIDSELVTFWSRSRQEMWTKGETSGNTLELVSITADCDGDAMLVVARPSGPICHTGSETCFGAPTQTFGFLDTLWATIESRATERPAGSYTTELLDGGPDLIGRKVAEEAIEVLIAAKNHQAGIDDDQRLAEEAGDLIYHLLVALVERGVDPALVTAELRRRHIG